MLLSFDIDGQRHTCEITEMVVAGWAGRDAHTINHHIEELAAIGVPRPSSVPLFYRVSTDRLCQAAQIQVIGADSSGEVEPFIFTMDGELYVTVVSDHTDRKLETHSVALSKQICAKPVARQAWRWSDVRPHWDRIMLSSWIDADGLQYQHGPAGSLLSPEELLQRYLNGRALPNGLGMTCGTVGVIGAIRPSSSLRIVMDDPVLKRRIEHRYGIHTLPEVA